MEPTPFPNQVICYGDDKGSGHFGRCSRCTNPRCKTQCLPTKIFLEKELGMAGSTPKPKEEKPDPSKESQKETSEDTQPSNDSQESPPEEVPTAQELLTKAKDHLSAGREVAAEVALRKHFSLYPKDKTHLEALYRYAEASFNRKKYQEAATRFQDVLNVNSNSPFAAWSLFRQGECFAQLGDEESARAFYEDVITDYPKSKAAKEAKKRLSK